MTTAVNDALIRRIAGTDDDLYQDIWVAALENPNEDIEALAKRLRKKATNQRIAAQHGPLSIDKPMGDEGDDFTLKDVIAAPEVEHSAVLERSRVQAGGTVELTTATGRKYRRQLRGIWAPCATCSKQMYSMPSRISKYCSAQCRKVGGWHGSPLERPKIHRDCKACGQPFEVQFAIAVRTTARYCSRQCYWKARPGLKLKPIAQGGPCLHCGQPFPIFKKSGPVKKFCSHKCSLRHWHGRATKEGRCHWCGEPSTAEYKAACARHVGYVRKKTERNSRDRRTRLQERGFCVQCGTRGTRKATGGFTRCSPCQASENARHRHRRKAVSLSRKATLQKASLVTVDDAARILHVHRVQIHQWIKQGRLRVKANEFRKFWIPLIQVHAIQREREAQKKAYLNAAIYRCTCSHRWRSLVVETKHRRRCPKCHSARVELLAAAYTTPSRASNRVPKEA